VVTTCFLDTAVYTRRYAGTSEASNSCSNKRVVCVNVLVLYTTITVASGERSFSTFKIIKGNCGSREAVWTGPFVH
jgi:hypothetical protein